MEGEEEIEAEVEVEAEIKVEVKAEDHIHMAGASVNPSFLIVPIEEDSTI